MRKDGIKAGLPGEAVLPRQHGRAGARGAVRGPGYPAMRVRPLRRRRLSTSRPSRVRIRTLKPWVFLRYRVLGCNVRFGISSPRLTAPGRPQGRADGVTHLHRAG